MYKKYLDEAYEAVSWKTVFLLASLIMGTGGYRVADFVRAGTGMSVLFLVVMLTVVNLLF